MKRIIAAALSVLVGTFGYTIVDKALEDRVATLESEVVELREEVSGYHPQYSEYDTTIDMSKPLSVGSYLIESSESLHKFLIREYTNGELRYISYNNYESVSFVNRTLTEIQPTTTRPATTRPATTHLAVNGTTNGYVTTTDAQTYVPVYPLADYFLYITESSAQITDISEEISYVYGYDKDYSLSSKPITTKTTTYITVLCKGYTDSALSGKKIVFYIFENDRYSITSLKYPKEIIVNKINSDGSFEYKAVYATTTKNCEKYSFAIIDMV